MIGHSWLERWLSIDIVGEDIGTWDSIGGNFKCFGGGLMQKLEEKTLKKKLRNG